MYGKDEVHDRKMSSKRSRLFEESVSEWLQRPGMVTTLGNTNSPDLSSLTEGIDHLKIKIIQYMLKEAQVLCNMQEQ